MISLVSSIHGNILFLSISEMIKSFFLSFE